MASRKTKRRKLKQASPKVPGNLKGIASQIVISLVAFAIIVSRRPDALFNAQFYAEDGVVWYVNAYQLGLRSFLKPEAGYLHALIRSVALVALFFPFSLAPLFMNLCAITVQILPVNIFLSSRFSQIPMKLRLLGSFLYLALPNSFEIDANITNVQWHLTLLACLLLLAPLENRKAWRIFDGVVLVVTSFSSPIGVVLVAVAAALWWKRRQRWSALTIALLVPGAVVEVLVALFSNTRPLGPNGPTFHRLIVILGGQVFFSSFFGMTGRDLFARDAIFPIYAIALVVGLAVVSYALFRAPVELRIFIVFCFATLVLALARPLAGPSPYPQWRYLLVLGRADRYFFLPILGFLASLLWIATAASRKWLRYPAMALLLLMSVGIYEDWFYPPFPDLHFHQYAAQFEQAPAGTKISFEIPPGMTMEITKR
jgi:hypothetical protein